LMWTLFNFKFYYYCRPIKTK